MLPLCACHAAAYTVFGIQYASECYAGKVPVTALHLQRICGTQLALVLRPSLHLVDVWHCGTHALPHQQSHVALQMVLLR